jgi:hypothetical protein
MKVIMSFSMPSVQFFQDNTLILHKNNDTKDFESTIKASNASQNIPFRRAIAAQATPAAHDNPQALVPAQPEQRQQVGFLSIKSWQEKTPLPVHILSLWQDGLTHGPNIESHTGKLSLEQKEQVQMHGQLVLQRTDNNANALFSHYRFNDAEYPRQPHTMEQENTLKTLLKEHDKDTKQLKSILDGLNSPVALWRNHNVRKLNDFPLEKLNQRYDDIMSRGLAPQESSYRIQEDYKANISYPRDMSLFEDNRSWANKTHQLAFPNITPLDMARSSRD